MRFLVSRSSEGAVSRKAPCKGAVRGPEAAAWPGQFQWFLDVDTLDDLMALLDRTGGGLGLFLPEGGEDHPVIEIFDEDEDED
jgi:hypothetical protein